MGRQTEFVFLALVICALMLSSSLQPRGSPNRPVAVTPSAQLQPPEPGPCRHPRLHSCRYMRRHPRHLPAAVRGIRPRHHHLAAVQPPPVPTACHAAVPHSDRLLQKQRRREGSFRPRRVSIHLSRAAVLLPRRRASRSHPAGLLRRGRAYHEAGVVAVVLLRRPACRVRLAPPAAPGSRGAHVLGRGRRDRASLGRFGPLRPRRLLGVVF